MTRDRLMFYVLAKILGSIVSYKDDDCNVDKNNCIMGINRAANNVVILNMKMIL